MTPVNTWLVQIDWDNDGSFATAGDDISAYVQHVDIQLGTSATGSQTPGPLSLTTSVGRCKVRLNNSDKRFSPANVAGPLYGKLIPSRPVRVQITDGVTTWTAFRGYTRSYQADNSQYGSRQALIECVDMLSQIQDATISIPLQENVGSGALIRHITNTALLAPAATGTITISAAPANNDTVTINGTVITFKTVLSGGANEVLIGTGRNIPSQRLAAAINGGSGAGTDYSSTMNRPNGITAS